MRERRNKNESFTEQETGRPGSGGGTAGVCTPGSVPLATAERSVRNMSAAKKTVWIDEKNRILSFHAVVNWKSIAKEEDLFWQYLLALMNAGYRIM